MQQSDPEFDVNDPFQAELLRKLQAARSERTELELWDPSIEEEMRKQTMALGGTLRESGEKVVALTRENRKLRHEIIESENEIASLREEIRRVRKETGKSVVSQGLSFYFSKLVWHLSIFTLSLSALNTAFFRNVTFGLIWAIFIILFSKAADIENNNAIGGEDFVNESL